MTKTESKTASAAVKDILLSDPQGLHEVIRAVMQEVLEAEMDEAVGASKGERTPERLGYRSGYYGRTPVTVLASLSCVFRRTGPAAEELCGHAFSASSISAINKRLDESLKAFAERPLQEPFAYLILDARYEKVREAGIVMSQAVLIAVGIDWDGRRQILAVAMANRASRSAWRDFLDAQKARGLRGVELVVSDDHAGLVAAIGNAATCTSSGAHSITCRRSTATTACRSYAGSMTGAILPRPRPISPHGLPNGRAAIRG
ncbi:hypothetical protein MesoLjLc_68990 [Mesorhizobium sp. L-8-10]|nr:hypothetical protein MesoLjLc_68990 [Mesorhizobium sp. L-8-10]